MTRIEQEVFERFAAKQLGELSMQTIAESALSRQGFDVSFLAEMVAAYAALPPHTKRYAVRLRPDRSFIVQRLPRAVHAAEATRVRRSDREPEDSLAADLPRETPSTSRSARA